MRLPKGLWSLAPYIALADKSIYSAFMAEVEAQLSGHSEDQDIKFV
jgi:hypothetical protein